MSDTSPRSRQRTARTTNQRGREVAQQRSRSWLWIAAVALVLAIPIGMLGYAYTQSGAAVGDIEGVETFSDVPAGHQDGELSYPQTPPAGGIHNGVWQNCGIYNSPVANENAVHSQEHGAVWITYRPDLPTDQIEQLKTLVRGRSHLLLSPYPDLPSPIAVSAWGVQLMVDQASDPRLAQFISKYAQGPQTPERGATCSGGQATAAGQP